MAALSRMEFLRGRFRGAPSPVRPPWALPESAFTAACRRCDDCLPVCPTQILKRGASGFPEVDFRLGKGECTFCAACLTACPEPAFDRPARNTGVRPWNISATISTSCLALNRVVCRSCGESCESGAIRFRLAPGGIALPELMDDRCTGCGACLNVCPAQAITLNERPAVAEAA